MGSLWVVVDRYGSLWVVPGFSNYGQPNLFSEAERANCFVCASGILTCIFGHVQKKYLKGMIIK